MRSRTKTAVVIGTSGFAYEHWRGRFYPEALARDQWLEFYARHFNGVEINSSFYHLPRESVVQAWHDRTPADFVFVLKGSRFVTHRARLRDCAEAVALFYRRVRPLGDKLRAVLWQLPPGLHADGHFLEAFLEQLPARPRPVLEFRDASWYTAEIFEVLEAQHATLCLHDMPAGQPPDRLTSPVAYLRFHGWGTRYGGTYPATLLRKRARWLADSGAEEIYAFFNNDREGHALHDAERLRRYLTAITKPTGAARRRAARACGRTG